MKKCLRLISMIVAAITVSVSVSACNRSIIGYIINGSDGQSTSIDAAKMTNDITTDKIHALFTVVATNSKISGWARIGGSARAQGSGVAFYKTERSRGGYYVFLLTNCHVAATQEGYNSVSYSVTDYAGNKYTAHLFKNTQKEVSAISADYDLACLYFETTVDYTCLEIADEDPVKNQTVVALGAPENQSNAITFGKVCDYIKTEVQADKSLSNVTFDVIYHDAYIDNGSSGGPLIDANYRIVGINYGGSEDNTVSLAVPATKITEFLKEYVYD